MVLVGDEAQLEARFGLFEIVLIVTQDRSTVCAEGNTSSDIVWDAPDETPR